MISLDFSQNTLNGQPATFDDLFAVLLVLRSESRWLCVYVDTLWGRFRFVDRRAAGVNLSVVEVRP